MSPHLPLFCRQLMSDKWVCAECAERTGNKTTCKSHLITSSISTYTAAAAFRHLSRYSLNETQGWLGLGAASVASPIPEANSCTQLKDAQAMYSPGFVVADAHGPGLVVARWCLPLAEC